MMKRILAMGAALLLCFSAGALALEDGTPTLERVTITGGTCRVAIHCDEVRVVEGQAYAVIVFDSPNYTRAVLDDQTYAAEHEDGCSVFTLPVPLNEAVTFGATTTAMSAAHEIAYTLFIGTGEGDPLAGLERESSMELVYAEGFSVDFYSGGYALIDVKDDARYLVVPQGKDAPEGLDPAIVVLSQPLDSIYLAASSAMALFDAIDAVDRIRLSGTRADDWTIESAQQAMADGTMLFAGKYSEPDYELLLREGCDLAIESTMILHTPKVGELLRMLGIPVFIDRSSYEPHPLGRTEWVKLYGVLTGRIEEAQAFFDGQAQMLKTLFGFPNTEKTVAFFYLHSNGAAVVRGEEDYIARMIDLAGGRYAFTGLAKGSASVQMTMEEFYRAAMDADVLIYNATIEAPISSVDELIKKDGLFAAFRAVREGSVYCTDSALYQATDRIGSMIAELHALLTGEANELAFLTHLN